MIHRDISSENILVYPDEVFKICDFGLVAYDNLSKHYAGKEEYMALEVRL